MLFCISEFVVFYLVSLKNNELDQFIIYTYLNGNINKCNERKLVEFVIVLCLKCHHLVCNNILLKKRNGSWYR